MSTDSIISKVWGFCTTLRDDGVGYGDYLEQLTYLIFLMNMFLHNIGEIDGESLISSNDALVADSGKRFDYVLANPPFGKKSSMTFTNEEGEQEKDDLVYNRQDFWATSANKQLNFLQHIRTMLKTTGSAAVVLPDNVLFEGGVGETVRKKLLENTDLHTILRLPTGIFYANDRGDLVEMIQGVWQAMGFDADAERLCLQNLLTASEKTRTGDVFLSEVVRPLLEKHSPDILRIDPLLAYLGDDPTDTKALARFCRNGLNPLLEEFKCAVILNHHTPKTTNRDTSQWRASDWMYSGAGGADLTNWARAILVIDPTSNPSAFKFIGAKRGKRLQWVSGDGGPQFQRIFCHSENSIAWRDATEAEVDGIRPKGDKGLPSEEELIAFVPMSGSIAKERLLDQWNTKKEIGQKRCRTLLTSMISDGKVFEWRIPRSKTNPEVHISRHEQQLV